MSKLQTRTTMRHQTIKKEGNPTATGRKYIVQEDESLSIIAREFYGNPSLWNHIYEANLDQIKDPNDIHAGQEIRIPELKK